MSLHVHTIKSAAGSRRSRKLVGRGNASGHGNYSGHGGKGQTARSGGSRGLRLKSFKFLLQSTPKLRGFTSLAQKPAEVYLGELDKAYQNGETVSLATLKEKKLIGGNAKNAKIILKGELSKKLIVEGVKCTVGVTEKIKAAGGEIK